MIMIYKKNFYALQRVPFSSLFMKSLLAKNTLIFNLKEVRNIFLISSTLIWTTDMNYGNKTT